MRKLPRVLMMILAAMTLAAAAASFGCASHKPTTSGTSSASQAPQQNQMAAGTKACVMQSQGRDVLRLTIPEQAKCARGEGAVVLEWGYRRVQVWLVPGASSLDEAADRVPQEIKGEFKEFKATQVSNLTIAASPARRLAGSGVEADDGDPATADVIVFKVGDHYF